MIALVQPYFVNSKQKQVNIKVGASLLMREEMGF